MTPDARAVPSPLPTQPLPSPVQWTRGLAVGSLLGLIVLCLLWELWLAPLRPGGSWLALKALPLALPLGGLLRNRMYTYRWVSLLVWIYFTEGVVRAASDRAPSSWLAAVEVALCVLLFAACAAQVRWRLRHPTAAGDPPEPSAKAAPRSSVRDNSSSSAP